MIAVDTNILIYAHRGESSFHSRAVNALDRLARSGRPWGTVWQCVHEFAAIVTHPKIFRPASTLEECLAEIENWQACPTFRCIAEGAAHWPVFKRVLREGRFRDLSCMTHGSLQFAWRTAWKSSGRWTATSAVSRSCGW